MRMFVWNIVGVSVLAGTLWLYGPYEEAPLTPDRAVLLGDDLDAYFAKVGARFDDITPGTEKRVVWAGEAGAKTTCAILYVHGFSATSEEIRPMPDRLAHGLDANLIYTRLQGHGRTSDALAEGTVQGWINDLHERLKAARRIGGRVLVLATSTGGTLVTAVARDTQIMSQVEGLVLVSPNYGLQNPLASLLTWPAARHWLPPLAGERRSFEPRNAAHATYWTTEYPSTALMPMAALIDGVSDMDHRAHHIPAPFYFSEADKVVRPDITAQVAAAWGAPAQVVNPVMGPQDDVQAHIIAGDVMSPGQTGAAVAEMLDWVRGLQ